MACGLINIVSYGASDLYLTGAPQITFFKMIYRRYTNFAMESIVQKFDNDFEFGKESVLTPQKAGDLIHKGYIRITVPKISIKKEDVGIDNYAYKNNDLLNNNDCLGNCDCLGDPNCVVGGYQDIKNIYTKILTDIYRIIYRATNAVNVNYSGLVYDVHTYVHNNNNNEILSEYNHLLHKTRKRLSGDNKIFEDYVILDPNRTNLWDILCNIDTTRLMNSAIDKVKECDPWANQCDEINERSCEYIIKINEIMKKNVYMIMTKAIDDLTKVQDLFFTEYKRHIKKIEQRRSENIRFAWTNRLGLSLIEYIDVFIGGKGIDRHTGIWMNILYELTHKDAQKQILKEMIGDVCELTNFDTLEKPEYTMYIPMGFWFNVYNGSSFPIIAMEYENLQFKVKLRELNEVSYIEKLYRVTTNGCEKIMTYEMLCDMMMKKNYPDHITSIEEVQNVCLSDIINKKKIMGDMMLDYVYLEKKERKMFAQMGHEYLINRMQYETPIDDINPTGKFSTRLNFFNPCKELFWLFHKDTYTNNQNGYTKCKWNDYTTGINQKNPLLDFEIKFNGYTRVHSQPGVYFNKFQPYTYYNTTINNGIYLQSFCLDPKQSQPTGSFNFSRLSRVTMSGTLDCELFRYTLEELYPHNINRDDDCVCDFVLTLQDPKSFCDKIDIKYIREQINKIKTSCNSSCIDKKTSHRLCKFEEYEKIYYNLKDGDDDKILNSSYMKIPLMTSAKFHVFDVSINILRLIGGYGSLAYSGYY